MKQNIVKELFLDSNQRLFFCGDLHGSIDLLDESLKELGFISGQDVLICVGDLVDRHPKSEESEDLPLDDILQKRFEDKDNIAFTFEKGISREEIRETNHKLRAQVRKQLNIQEDLDNTEEPN